MAAKVYVMGALVLDIVPGFRSQEKLPVAEVFAQGKVTELSSVSFSMGGCVGNTGLALHKLGIDTTLGGKVGRDFAGSAIRMLISQAGAPYRLIESGDAPTACGIGMTPPGIDKITLFLKGASQQYTSADVADLTDCDLFHFGYPASMKSLYANDGEELMRMMKHLKETGSSTSLDMSLPHPDGEHGRVEWRPILKKVLPYVDAFVPSYEECLFMLDREAYIREVREAAGEDLILRLTDERVRSIADAFLEMGAKIVLIKLGSRGAYLRTADGSRLGGNADGEGGCASGAGRVFGALGREWQDREMWIFPTQVPHIVSTTGAGDTTIAGFLTALLEGCSWQECLHLAAAAGASCVQTYDSLSGLPTLAELKEKIRRGWSKDHRSMKEDKR